MNQQISTQQLWKVFLVQNHGIFCSTHILLKMGDQTLPTVDFWIKSRTTVYITAKDTEKKANSTHQRCLFSDLFCPNVRNGSCKAKSVVLGVQTAANHIWWCESDYSAPLHKYKLYSQSLQIIWCCAFCTRDTAWICMPCQRLYYGDICGERLFGIVWLLSMFVIGAINLL